VQGYRCEFKAMGSPCELQIVADDARVAQRGFGVARAEVERLEQRYSRYRVDSLLSQINRVAAAGGRIELDAETGALLDYAAACYVESGGLFDVTSGILRRAWNFARSELPEPGRVQALLERVGWDKLDWNPPSLGFPLAGMELDLGGIVKEYAADRVAALCREAGVWSGLVNLGGDIRIVGPRPDGQPWRVGIRDPRRHDRLVRTLELESGALATSGDYERCIVIDGVRFGHLLNPRTGWPVRRLASVSVVAPHCVVAGSAATIALLKEESGPAWLEQLGLPCHWIDVDGNTGGALSQRTAA
jgi:thiamine biosynthesis lipoprotein